MHYSYRSIIAEIYRIDGYNYSIVSQQLYTIEYINTGNNFIQTYDDENVNLYAYIFINDCFVINQINILILFF